MAPTNSPLQPSPFLQCSPTTQTDQLAILHLKRDLLLPTLLRSQDDANEGYDEGKVTNTRFGSFPHSTLLNVPWGSQVRASAVDTGSRGRKGWQGASKKRKKGQGWDKVPDDTVAIPSREESAQQEQKEQKAAVSAASGFVHILPPTPEIWTASLPHRTQVVYTPDYSYILHRLRARPGTRLIEAGAGSGSFTHAAARAVFNGYPSTEQSNTTESKAKPHGKVFSFEFHEQRGEKLQQELSDHGLDPIIELTNADVCADGFIPKDTPIDEVKANAIFLDLPAPWLALKHLTRPSTSISLPTTLPTNPSPTNPPSAQQPPQTSTPSPLDPSKPIHISTFSPCIEQVQRTISTLRQNSWTQIETVELASKRIEIRRERVGLQEEGLRGVSDHPANVEEAIGRLREVEGRTRDFHAAGGGGHGRGDGGDDGDGDGHDNDLEHNNGEGTKQHQQQQSKQSRLLAIKAFQPLRKIYKEGRLITKAEPEIKTHTSYLTFAVLPVAWTDADEEAARRKWGDRVEWIDGGGKGALSKRARKKKRREVEGGNLEVVGVGEREGGGGGGEVEGDMNE